MKAKINFSGAGIKQFFITNGEKIVLGLTALMMLVFLYSVITAKPLDDSKSPDAIKRESQQLVATIQDSTWGTHRNEMGLAPTHFKEQVDESMRPISGQKVRPTHEWNPALFPELIKRADPEIYAVEELQIAAGCGIVPYRSETTSMGVGGPAGPAGPGGAQAARPGFAGGGPMVERLGLPGGERGPGAARPGGFRPGEEGARGLGSATGEPGRIDPNASLPGVRAPGADAQRKSFVVITGAVPVEKEVEEFRRRFESAVPPIPAAEGGRFAVAMQATSQTDLPHYFCFLIDRAEVKDANDTNRDWVSILSKQNYVNSDALKDLAKWYTVAPEIVHPDDVFQPEPFNTQYFYVTWPLPPLFLKNWGFEASHPKVKLNIAQEAAAAQENQPAAAQNGNLDTITPDRAAGMNGRFGPGVERGPVAPMRGPMGAPSGPGFRGNFGPGPAGPGMGPGAQAQAEVFVDPYKLFRFVDLTAEPGKTYRYRVQLLINNPNKGLSQDCLDSKAIAAGSDKKKLVESPWTESPAITVPHDYQVLADSINVPGGKLSDLTAKINLLAIAKTPSAESQTGGASANTGAAANSDTWVEVVKNDMAVPLGGIVNLHDAELEKVLDMSSETVRKVEKISVDTDQTMLLDVRNDKPLGDGKGKDATEMLFMDASGRLIDADRAADKLVLDDYQERTKLPSDSAAGNESTTPRPSPRTSPYPGPGTRPGRATAPGGPRGPGGAPAVGPRTKE